MANSLIDNKLLNALLLLLLVPLLVIMGMAFYQRGAPGIAVQWSLEGFGELLTPLRLIELGRISARALLICLTGTAIAFIISYFLVFYSSKSFQYFFYALLTLPFFINESVRVFSWQQVLAENGLFNYLTGTQLFNGSNSINIYVVMLIACIPFGIFINAASLGTIPEIYWKAAADLNIKPWQRFIKIAVPFSKFAILTSCLVLFFIAFAMSAEVNFLGGDSKISTRNLVLSLMSASKFQSIFSLGLVLILLLFGTLILYKYSSRNKIA